MASPRDPATGRSNAQAVFSFILDNSLLLMGGALIGLVWANVNYAGYSAIARALVFAVNDVAMVFFFALAMKEVYEAMLPGGPLSSLRAAGLPVLAAVGGMAGPASIYLLSVWFWRLPDLHSGWAIPCATDIAFSYLVSRAIFPRGHPAIPFLLLLAIADDALGLVVLAVFYPVQPVSLVHLAGLLGPALWLAWTLRKFAVENFWVYVLGPGLLSWLGLYWGGLHPALALVPIVPLMPHSKVELKVFRGSSPIRLATIHHFERWWRIPVQFILLAFGFVNAGVPLSSVGPVTGIIFASLLIGKPIGIVATALLAERVGFRRAPGLDYRSLVTLGIAAGIGFTVALFFTTAAGLPETVVAEAKMGALLSFFVSLFAMAAGRLLGVGKR